MKWELLLGVASSVIASPDLSGRSDLPVEALKHMKGIPNLKHEISLTSLRAGLNNFKAQNTNAQNSLELRILVLGFVRDLDIRI